MLAAIGALNAVANRRVLDSFTAFQHAKKESRRFTALVHLLRTSHEHRILVGTLCLINAIIHGNSNVFERHQVRREFLELGFLDIVNVSSKFGDFFFLSFSSYSEMPRCLTQGMKGVGEIGIQIGVFLEEMKHDQSSTTLGPNIPQLTFR
jgi:hypothetical protein